VSASATFIPTPTTRHPVAWANVGRRYVTAAVQTGIGGIISRVLQGFAAIVLARCLGPKEYGVYALMLSLVGTVAGVSSLGQNVALQKFLPEYAFKDPRRGGAILANTLILVSGVLAVFCLEFYILSARIASNLYHDPGLTPVFRFSALWILVLSLSSLVSSAVAGLQNFKAYSLAMIASGAAFLGLGWLGVSRWGLYGALLGQVLASFFGLVLLTVVAWKMIHLRFPGAVRPVFSASILKEIFDFALPSLLAGLLVSPAYWWANTLLARHTGFEQVGLFGVAFGLAQLILLVPSTLSIPAVSFMSEVHAHDNRSEFSGLVSTNLRLVWVLTLPMAVGCALFAYPIITLLFGGRYEGATTLVLPMSIVALLMVINNVIGSAIIGSGRMWNGFLLNLFWLAAFLALGTFTIPRWGAAGIALTFVASYFLFTVAVGCYAHRALRVDYLDLGRLAGVSLAGFGMGATVIFYLHGLSGCLASVVVLTALLIVEWKCLLGASERVALLRSIPWHNIS
jgi:O-antigen/teichoic acid export membrane protein